MTYHATICDVGSIKKASYCLHQRRQFDPFTDRYRSLYNIGSVCNRGRIRYKNKEQRLKSESQRTAVSLIGSISICNGHASPSLSWQSSTDNLRKHCASWERQEKGTRGFISSSVNLRLSTIGSATGLRKYRMPWPLTSRCGK